jgi:hypothetical protein
MNDDFRNRDADGRDQDVVICKPPIGQILLDDLTMLERRYLSLKRCLQRQRIQPFGNLVRDAPPKFVHNENRLIPENNEVLSTAHSLPRDDAASNTSIGAETIGPFILTAEFTVILMRETSPRKNKPSAKTNDDLIHTFANTRN